MVEFQKPTKDSRKAIISELAPVNQKNMKGQKEFAISLDDPDMASGIEIRNVGPSTLAGNVNCKVANGQISCPNKTNPQLKFGNEVDKTNNNSNLRIEFVFTD